MEPAPLQMFTNTTDQSLVPFSPIQKAIWFGQGLAENEPIYNTGYAFSFQTAIDTAAFSRAHKRLVKATDSLQLVVVSENGQPYLKATSEPLSALQIVDASNWEQSKLQSKLEDEIRHHLDLTQCTWRSILFVRPKGHCVWFFLHHHLLTDGDSFRILLQRQSAFYDAETSRVYQTRSASSYPQFKDWLDLQSSNKTTTSSKSSGEANTLFTSGPSNSSSKGERIVSALSPRSAKALTKLRESADFASFSPDLTLSQILLTVLFALLRRLEDKETITIGVSTHSRKNKRDRETAGIFVRVVPLTICIQGSDSFKTLFDRVSTGLIEQIHGASESQAIQEQATETNVVYNFLSGDLSQFGNSPVQSEWLYPGCHEPANHLRLHIDNTSRTEQPSFLFDFKDTAFPGQTKEVSIALFARTIEEFAQDPNQLIYRFPLIHVDDPFASMSASEIPSVHKQSSLWTAFKETSAANPDRIAILSETSEISYERLERWAEALSASSQFERFEHSQVIPIHADRSGELVAASLATLRIGKTFSPIDPELPPNRINDMVADCGAPSALDADSIRFAPSGSKETLPESTSDSAYLIYTSGSTGKPNGVLVGHQSVFNLLSDIEFKSPLENGSRCMWWTAVGFDVSIYEVYSSILYGHTLCIPPNSIRSNATRLFQWMRDMAINAAYLPPFFLADFLRWLKSGKRVTLQRLLVGVEPIDETLLTQISALVPKLKIVNGYGPTETTICATTYQVPRTAPARRTPIGIPVSGNRCYVLDTSRNLKPRGTQGELYVGGSGLALGYWRRPELQSVRFLDDPFSVGSDFPKMYKTGDLVRMDESGVLHFIGRSDSQLKLRGLRIEPAEIEETIRKHDDVERAIVRVAPLNDHEEIVCYYVGHSPISDEELTAFASAELPIRFVPKLWIHLETLPTTRNGKINYGALPNPDHSSRPFVEFDLAPPQTELETQIYAAFSHILNQETFPIHKSFFDLGGTSLAAMELLNHVNARYDLELSLRTLYLNPSIQKLANEVQTQLADSIDSLSESQIDRMLETYRNQ